MKANHWGNKHPAPDNYAIGALERAEAAKTPKQKAGAV
jgi:hypothetical protein